MLNCTWIVFAYLLVSVVVLLGIIEIASGLPHINQIQQRKRMQSLSVKARRNMDKRSRRYINDIQKLISNSRR